MNQTIATDKAPAAIGPYAQGIRAGEFIFTSGELPVNMATGELETEIKAATRACITNCEEVLAAAGAGLENVIKTTVFISDLALFAEMNEVYAECFGENKPARACVQVAALPKNALLEIEMIARK